MSSYEAISIMIQFGILLIAVLAFVFELIKEQKK